MRRQGTGTPHRSAVPSSQRLPDEFEDCASILRDHFHPCRATHHREVDPAETETREQDVDAKTQRLMIKRIDSLFYCLRTVRISPSVLHLGMSLRDGHLQRCVGHLKRYELLPV